VIGNVRVNMPVVIRDAFGIAAICAGLISCSGGTATASPFITPHGIGALRLHATVKSLHRKGVIGGLRKGCELDPGQRVAPLRAPLRGWAVFSSGGNRLSAFTIEGGAETARHIGIGSPAAEARKAYPDALYEGPGTVEPFAEGFLWVPNLSKPKLTMIIEPGFRQVEAISVPSPNFCE
jgi:hypothetical protein